MAAEIVGDDNTARFERRDQGLLNPRCKTLAIDRAVEDAGRNDAVVAQTGNEGQRFPMSVRYFVDERLTFRVPAMGAGHIGFGPGFVDKDHAPEVYLALDPAPAGSAARDVGPILFFGEERLFLNVLPQRLRNRHSVSQHTSTPRSSRNCASKA